MNKFVIAAVAAALLGSTSASLADDSGRETYESALAFLANQQQYANPQINNVRNAQAQIAGREQHVVKTFTAEENAYFDRATPQTAN